MATQGIGSGVKTRLMAAPWQWSGRCWIITRRQAFQAHGKTAVMRSYILAFAAGIWFLQQQPDLPAPAQLTVIGVVALLALAVVGLSRTSAQVVWRILRRLLLVIGAAGFGFLWAAGFAHWRLAEELPGELEGRDIEVRGVVAGLPQELERGLRFNFDVEEAVPGVPRQISLAWYRGADSDADEARVCPCVPANAGAYGAPQASPRQCESMASITKPGCSNAVSVPPATCVRAPRPSGLRRGSGSQATRWRCCARRFVTASALCCPRRPMPAS
jgi:hypothetical protein